GHLRTLYNRYEWTHSSRVGSITKPQLLLQSGDVCVHLPSGGAVHRGTRAENLYKLLERKRELTTRPRLACPRHAVLPLDMVVGVHADLEAPALDFLHKRAAAPPYVRPGQQNSIEKGFEAIVLQHRGPFHLTHEAGAQYPLDCAAGVVRSDTEQEGGTRPDLSQYLCQPWNTF